MDVARLRELLRPHIGALRDHATASEFPALCAKLSMSYVDEGTSKRERLLATFDAVPDGEVPKVAQRVLEHFPPRPTVRNSLQDVLWADARTPAIPRKHRRDLARALDHSDLYRDAGRFDVVITSLFVIDDDPFGGPFGTPSGALRAGIERHVYANPGDWTPEVLFDRLGAYECSDRRFCLFLEGMASSAVRPDDADQRHFVALVNGVLRACGVELTESSTEGGYPVFTTTSLGGGPVGRPKNLIFASSVKPDLRLRDAVSNEIEIATGADRVLVYDRPIGPDGLRWRDLQAWWADREGGLDATHAKNTLYRRLEASLPSSSPPQSFLFHELFKAFGPKVQDLPALLPEVWLHWDPKTVEERGFDAMARFRMDFLLLLSHGHRVVIEVDGKHHYAGDDGRASPARYASMMAADRDLRLAGYEVFRFGAAELDGGDAAVAVVKNFFEALFNRHGISLVK